LRLLLDEMYPSSIAEGLRGRHHDVHAVVDRTELRNVPDPELFAVAQAESRAVVTENVVDFIEIADERDARRAPHYGIVLVPAAPYPRGNPRTIGAMVTALDALLGRYTSDEPTSLRVWL
jgi:hypothetical protein